MTEVEQKMIETARELLEVLEDRPSLYMEEELPLELRMRYAEVSFKVGELVGAVDRHYGTKRAKSP